ncbi:hypothetical protein CBR_g8509 [Chara braunii]|uniref:DUF4360 domain-containing protein n=1 Tax=Chara braunii TaxID=69332 RepID=A0A388KMC4_CHABU|nr:hypothetical protein CBR_g8509 [Chara braunii]|eukprot:GBG71206.1 hypothetical protein CBR_g8509 [Chara braunii]
MEQRLLRTVCPITETAGRLLLLLVLLLILQLACPGQVSALQPPPGSVKINDFDYAGSGCPPGSVELVMSDDGNAMTLKFTKHLATTYKSAVHRKRTCTASVGLSYPAEFAIGVGSVSVRGYAKLDGGVSGSIKAPYYFSGQRGMASSKRVIKGPFNNNFEYSDSFGPVYSACGTEPKLSIVTEIKVNPGRAAKGGGFIRVESTPQILDLVWKRC